jgi:hypothetical protein
MSAFGVKLGRYLEHGHLGENVHCHRHLLDDAFLKSSQILQLTRRLLWAGYMYDVCHPGVRVFFEFLLQL